MASKRPNFLLIKYLFKCENKCKFSVLELLEIKGDFKAIYEIGFVVCISQGSSKKWNQ